MSESRSRAWASASSRSACGLGACGNSESLGLGAEHGVGDVVTSATRKSAMVAETIRPKAATAANRFLLKLSHSAGSNSKWPDGMDPALPPDAVAVRTLPDGVHGGGAELHLLGQLVKVESASKEFGALKRQFCGTYD